jgi:hypothetical protein
MRYCKALDAILLGGRFLEPPTEDARRWHVSSLYRITGLGAIELWWAADAKATALEAQLDKITVRISKILDKHSHEHTEQIEYMEFVYNNPEPDAIEVLDPNNLQSES